MYKIKTLNHISALGLSQFPENQYQISDTEINPDAIVLRSYKMHDYVLPDSVKAIGRAGAGVNNIPLDYMTKKGVPVFNAPGANANAVKELVLASLFLSARHLSSAVEYTKKLKGDDEQLAKLVEQGKKKFAGSELPGKTIGVIGLGAIGRMVANTCIDLGMNVIGYDPGLTVEGAWQLSSAIQRIDSVDMMLPKVDFLTVHVPLIDATRDLINAQNLKKMPPHSVLINLARSGIVNDAAVVDALNNNGLAYYVTDFPNNKIKQCENVIALPHLGASTCEAEDNCAIMVAQQIMDYFDNGNISNSVNFPNVYLTRGSDYRVAVCNRNVPNMLGQISTIMASEKLNIIDMMNKSRNEIAYTVVDVDKEITTEVLTSIQKIEGVILARLIPNC